MYELRRMTINGTKHHWAFGVYVNSLRIGKFVGGILTPDAGVSVTYNLMSFLCEQYNNQASVYHQAPGV